jgi:phospholipid/cholesterol/gamma-HCH transport system permease protein
MRFHGTHSRSSIRVNGGRSSEREGAMVKSGGADHAGTAPTANVESCGDGALVQVAGQWQLEAGRPSAESILETLAAASSAKRVAFSTESLTGWDSSLLVFLAKLESGCLARGLELDRSGLPEGARRLLALAKERSERTGARRQGARQGLLAQVWEATERAFAGAGALLEFIGDVCLAYLRLFTGRVRFRRKDFLLLLEQAGADAVPITSLISFLVGVILSFIGAVQLSRFGAQIYVADLVGIAMTRVLGAVMTGVIMAGRTGAAYAAQLGTMQVNDEIDALRTLGVSPVEFLVLPRMLALATMLPLLTLYADLMGILGGVAVSVGMLGVGGREYLSETFAAVNLGQIGIGIFHGAVFGVLVALAGCLRGMQCGRSSAAVGAATTSAVVTGIVWIVVATAAITAGCNVLDI